MDYLMPIMVWTDQQIEECDLPKLLKEKMKKMNECNKDRDPNRNPYETDGGFFLVFDTMQRIVSLELDSVSLEGLEIFEDEDGSSWLIGISIHNNETSVVYVISYNTILKFNAGVTSFIVNNSLEL
jgi:hypothetical protein